jgi:hypothetical protein
VRAWPRFYHNGGCSNNGVMPMIMMMMTQAMRFVQTVRRRTHLRHTRDEDGSAMKVLMQFPLHRRRN